MNAATAPPAGLPMGTSHNNIPITGPNMNLFNRQADSQPKFPSSQSARRDYITSTINPISSPSPASSQTTCSSIALEVAASKGSLSAVQKLLRAGAKVRNGAPLYAAVSNCPPGVNEFGTTVTQSKPFDKAQIPIMALLVENGADVNQGLQSPHMTAKYPIVQAVMLCAPERVKWLLSQGADPHLKGAYGSACEYAKRFGSPKMKAVLGVQD
ncbi:hypothetical protein FSARC_3608 [Fusarium sarcochroum]|uniref:Ankyrin n=1 Tax=Fusarium sarcochroum TaxID=1208366 RepID=A0A8H4U406_9HYPO|nr:hypothetical protein FSARC_3608 [Fusarium sarcochroum]